MYIKEIDAYRIPCQCENTVSRPYLLCRHLIPALKARAARCPVATQLGCVDDLKTEHSFDSQATSVIDVLGFVTVTHGCFLQPDTENPCLLVLWT